MRRRRLAIAAMAVGLLVFALGVHWFAPHKLFIDARVSEPEPGGMTTVARGAFRSLEHGTRGTAVLVKLGDGRHALRLHDLETSNGPLLHVYLSSEPPQDDWFVYDDGEYLDLGPLKGNLGSSNYDVPPGADLSKFASAVVWCRRFSVGFGVAPLDPVP